MFSVIDNFDSLLNGSVRNQGNWQTNQPGATDGAIVTSTPPFAFSGKALTNDPNGIQFRGNAYNSLGSSAIANNSTGTFFFQIYNNSLAGSNLSIGLSDVSAPGLGFDNTGTPVSFGDYEIQVTFANGQLRVRDGNQTRRVTNVSLLDDTLYNFWMVANTGSDTYNVYIQGGNISNQTQLSVNGSTEFGFRNGNASSDLTTYLQLNGSANPPTAESYIDYLAIDQINENLANPAPGAPGFTAVETFEDINTGSVNGQNGWSASSNSVSVVSDPASNNNNVLQVEGSNVYARKSTPDIVDGTDGTLFFRLRRSGSPNSFAGLSDSPQATEWSDFENQVGFQNSSQFQIRDGGSFDSTELITPNLWHAVWLVTNNATDTYEVFARGGNFNTVTQLASGSQTAFSYRNGTNGALSDFLLRTGLNNSGTLLIDDIYLDSTGSNLSLPGSNGVEFSQTNTGPLDDPIPAIIDPSGLSVSLNEIAQIPASQTNKPLARINYLTHANDNSDRLFVNDLNNRLYVINNGNVSTYLDVEARFPDFVDAPRLGTGFGFFAFAPDFAQSGKFYTVHTEAGDALSRQADYSPKTSTSVHGIITEWTASNPAANTFSGTSRELLRVGFETFLHGFQQIGFNTTATPGSPDYGLLYIAAGDGEQNPLFSNGPQDLSVPHGKILRIDPDGSNSPNGQYGIPASNPFVSQTSALDEIWAYGLRNPHRFSWDAEGSNQMFIGNIGEKNIESIYPGIAGANYGWNIREGAFLFDKTDPNNVYSLPANDDQFGITYPVAQWDHDEGLAVVGGFVYRGDDIPQLSGQYIFGDIVRGRIFHTDVEDMVVGGPPATIDELLLVDIAGNQQTLLDLVDSRRADLRFGIDADNGIYILSKQTGQIWKLENNEDNSGGPEPSSLVLEAEDINSANVTGYRIENNSVASGGSMLSLVGQGGGETGTASFDFTAADGTYQVFIGTFDERDGNAQLQITQNGTAIAPNLVLNANPGGAGANSTTIVELPVATVSISTGDTFEITGFENGGEHARFDYIRFESDGPVSEADPVISAPDTVTVEENQTFVLNINATDANGDTEGNGLTYSLTGGTDQGEFSINTNTGVLTFIDVPDFENPGDNNGDNIYGVDVTVTDSNGDTDSQLINVSVSDVNETGGGSTIRLEAEAASNIVNYRTENIGAASGGQALSFIGNGGGETGEATFGFNGAAGNYDIILGTFDEADGNAFFTVDLNDFETNTTTEIATLDLNGSLGSNGANATTAISPTVATGIFLTPGDTITVNGNENSSEHARLDYVEFVS